VINLNQLLKIKQEIEEKRHSLSRIKSNLLDEKTQENQISNDISLLAEAQAIIQRISQEIQQEAHKKIAEVVSLCLESVFEKEYSFRILFEQKRGRTEAKLMFEKEGKLYEPMDGSGGGVVDVAAFALRLSCMLLAKPKLQPVIILDEPFKFVSKTYLPNLKNLLEKLSEDFNVQFIIITHISELVSGEVIEI
jgi:ABC-type branched-subunit amino acid transport system ATPase component